MSTKNLSRTPIEGGRYASNKEERRNSSKVERRKTQQFLNSVRRDDDLADKKIEPKRRKVSKEFHDRLGPVKRFIDSKVGKSWNKVYSELMKKFDVRTVAGRHITQSHILDQIWLSQDHSSKNFKYYQYYVDAQGILRSNAISKKLDKQYWDTVYAERSAIQTWLAGRMIAKVGNVLYWYEPTRPFRGTFDWFYGVHKSENQYTSLPLPRYLRAERLSGRDIEFFTTLMAFHKEKLLERSEELITEKISVGWFN